MDKSLFCVLYNIVLFNMPASILQFNNPPVKEAIFGIRFSESATLEAINSIISSKFFLSRFKERAEWKAQSEHNKAVRSNQDQSYSSATASGGLFYRTEDGKRLLQINTTQITYHNLDKYDGWDVMLQELKELWGEFCLVVKDIRIQQINVRYINQLILPYPFEQGLQEYVTVLPSMPTALTSSLNNFFIQLEIPGKAPEYQATITETILGYEQNKMNLILDLGVFRNGLLAYNTDDLWLHFGEIRTWKNELFNLCITEKTKKLFD